MTQSKGKWLAYLVARVVAYRCLVLLRDWLLGATMTRESQEAENEAEAASHLVHRSGSEPSFRGSTPSRCFERHLPHGTVVSDTRTPLLAYRIRGITE